MIGRQPHRLKRGAAARRSQRAWRHLVAVAALSLTGLVLAVPMASASVPTSTTEAASGISYQRATLNGTVNPGGLVTTYHFEYGETTSYGTKIPVPDHFAGEGASNVKVSYPIRWLKIGPTYHFRLVATNSEGTTYGSDVTFSTATWALKGQEPETGVSVSSKGSVKLHVEKLPVLNGGGAITLECSTTGERTVGQTGAGTDTKLTLSGCKVLSSTNTVCSVSNAKIEKAEATGLPWSTSLVTSEGATREQIAEDGKGKPGLAVTCNGLKLTVTGFTSVAVKAVAGGVDETFDSLSGVLVWTPGGSGTLEGTQLIASPSEREKLTVGLSAGEWLVFGKAPAAPVAVASKGTLTLELGPTSSEGGGFVVTQCTDNSERTLSPGGEGEVSVVKLTGCEVVRSTNVLCRTGEKPTVTALGLPLHTALVTSEGTTRDAIAESGGYSEKCGSLEAKGTGMVSMNVTDVSGGVEQSIQSSVLFWTGVKEATLEIGQLLENPGGSPLTYKVGS